MRTLSLALQQQIINYVLPEFFKEYREVNSLQNLSHDKNYITRNYDMFTHLKHNRGTETGYDEKRVMDIMMLVLTDNFDFELAIVAINLNGVSLEGNCRIEAFRRLGIPVLFHLCISKRLNTENEIDLLTILTRYNSYIPTWLNSQQLSTAELCQLPLATLLIDKRASIIANIDHITEKNLQTNFLFTLADRNNTNTHAKKRQFNEYNNRPDMIEFVTSEQFDKDILFFCDIIGILVNNSNVDRSKVIEHTLKAMRINPEFNRDVFLMRLRKYGFHLNWVSVSNIKNKINEFGKL